MKPYHRRRPATGAARTASGGSTQPSGRAVNGRNASCTRRGVAAVEGALVVSVFLFILFGMLDLGLLVLQYNMLTEGTRHLARSAMVHGAKASSGATAWGPAIVTGNAADGSQYAKVLQQELGTAHSADINFTVDWPAGTNDPDDPVQVKLSYSYQPLIPFLFGSGQIALQSISKVRIAH